MNRQAQSELALKFTKTWPKGPGVEVWAEVLADMDFTQASATYVHLRNTEDHPPSVAQFLAAYKGIVGPPAYVPPRPLSDSEKRIASAVAAEVIASFKRKRFGVLQGEGEKA